DAEGIMAKRQGPKVRNGRQPAGQGNGKQIVVEDLIYMKLDQFRPEDQREVEELIASPDRLQRLVKGAPRAGSARKYGVVDVTPRLTLVFDETPGRIRLVELFDKE